MDRIQNILKNYISGKVAQKFASIFWQMFNGIQASFEMLEYRMDINKRERNMKTAQYSASLMNHAAHNGFEPILQIPSKGFIKLEIKPSLYSRAGYPLFILPYTVFVDKITKLEYYFNSDKPMRLSEQTVYVPVVEGQLITKTASADGGYINRIYLDDANIAQDSISLECGGSVFKSVNNFAMNENVNNNKLFITKYSSDPQQPIVLYVKGCSEGETIQIAYRITAGEQGNIDGNREFDVETFIDSNGVSVDISNKEFTATSHSGFTLGSSGTSDDELRAAIGYNHSTMLLFDTITYGNFVRKYSTIVLQRIEHGNAKSIFNLYLSKRINIFVSSDNYESAAILYDTVVSNSAYLLTGTEKNNLSSAISEQEFGLTSHNLHNAATNRFAIQVLFDNSDNLEACKQDIYTAVYSNFATFLTEHYAQFHVAETMAKIMEENSCTFSFSVLSEDGKTYTAIDSLNFLPLLSGGFAVTDDYGNEAEVFFGINLALKD